MLSISPAHNSEKQSIFLNMLHIPFITKNLFSLAKFTKDNNALMEFHANYVYMNDKRSG